jgi:hypothetical protein
LRVHIEGLHKVSGMSVHMSRACTWHQKCVGGVHIKTGTLCVCESMPSRMCTQHSYLGVLVKDA